MKTGRCHAASVDEAGDAEMGREQSARCCARPRGLPGWAGREAPKHALGLLIASPA